MTAALLHGWGFDRTLWRDLAAALGGACVAGDRGYFGEPAPLPATARIAIGHSLGALLLLRALPEGCRGLVAINGFDRFVGGEGTPGIAPRVLARMRARFAEAPRAVLDEFRTRCGAAAAPAEMHPAPLGSDLALLAEADERDAAALFDRPILVLHGDADPILPAELRRSVFGQARNVERATIADGGHLLPLSHPAWCAERIRAFAERIA